MPSDQFSGNHSPDWSHYSMLPTLTLTFSNHTKDLVSFEFIPVLFVRIGSPSFPSIRIRDQILAFINNTAGEKVSSFNLICLSHFYKV